MAFSWQQDITSGTPIESSDILEIRSNVDAIDANKCIGHNSTHDGSDYGTHLLTHNETVRTSNWSPYNTAYDATVRATHDMGHNGDHYGTYL